MRTSLGERDNLRGGMMGLEMPFQQIIQNNSQGVPQVGAQVMPPAQGMPQSPGGMSPQGMPPRSPMPQGGMPPQQPQAMGRLQMPPQAPQQAPQPPRQVVGQPTALGQPQAPQTPPQAPQQQNSEIKDNFKGYNGTIDIDGKKIEVKDGVLDDKSTIKKAGGKLFVTSDGEMIITEKGQIVGYVKDGKATPMDATQKEKLIKDGLIQDTPQQKTGARIDQPKM